MTHLERVLVNSVQDSKQVETHGDFLGLAGTEARREVGGEMLVI